MEKLTAQLKSGELERVYLLFGSEEYLIHFYGKRLTDKSVVKAALKSGLKGQLSSAIDFLKRIINH